jgi:hypothetical protein
MPCRTLWIGTLATAVLAWACGGTVEQTGTSGAAGIDGSGGSGAVGGSGGKGGSCAVGGSGAVGGAGGRGGSGATGGAGGTAGVSGIGGGGAGGGCPTEMPNSNVSCQSEGMTCSYAVSDCPPPNNNAFCMCSGGRWGCTTPSCPPTTGCPSQPPPAGLSCGQPQRDCWYGNDPRWYCRDRYSCTQGRWEQTGLADCTGPSNRCPADPTQPPDGVCNGSGNTYCEYGPGYACECQFGGFGGETWGCMTPPGGGCPDLMPNAGTTCMNLYVNGCDYGYGCSGVMMECKNNTWEMTGQRVCAQ